MEMIKLVASDLDGTLLLNKAQSLPEEIFPLIRQLQEMGIIFVAASGRQYPNMRKLFAPVASEISYISENGALAVDHGEVLYQDSFDRELANEIISAIMEKKDAEFTCSAKDYHYLMPKTKKFHDHMLYEVKNECRFVKSLDEMTDPIMKLAVFEPGGLTEESVKYWTGRFGKDCVVVTSGNEWIDFIPCHYNEPTEGEVDEIGFSLEVYDRLWQADLFYQYPEPADFKYDKLPKINRFIELFGDSENSEPNITSFLAQRENHFILNMGFMGTGVHSQVKCDWQSEEKDEIIPDFFVVRANGYADIVEFKLPKVKGNTVVGRNNREQFSAEINSYIAQTRVYRSYFEDPNNRKWFEEKYGFKVYKPKRYLVVGRRNDFECDEWVEIKADYTDVEIVTYDDLIDTVVSQFYQ